jgi:hypothetical protein
MSEEQFLTGTSVSCPSLPYSGLTQSIRRYNFIGYTDLSENDLETRLRKYGSTHTGLRSWDKLVSLQIGAQHSTPRGKRGRGFLDFEVEVQPEESGRVGVLALLKVIGV